MFPHVSPSCRDFRLLNFLFLFFLNLFIFSFLPSLFLLIPLPLPNRGLKAANILVSSKGELKISGRRVGVITEFCP